MKIIKIPISTPFIQLDAFLKLSGHLHTGGQAKKMIQAGQIQVNGETCTQRGKKIYPNDQVQVCDTLYEVHNT